MRESYYTKIPLPRKYKVIMWAEFIIVILVLSFMSVKSRSFRSIAGNSEGWFAVLRQPVDYGFDYELMFFNPQGEHINSLRFSGQHISYEICCFDEDLFFRVSREETGRLYDFSGNYKRDAVYPGKIRRNVRYIGDTYSKTAEYKKELLSFKEYILLYREDGTITVDITEDHAYVKLLRAVFPAILFMIVIYTRTADIDGDEH